MKLKTTIAALACIAVCTTSFASDSIPSFSTPLAVYERAKAAHEVQKLIASGESKPTFAQFMSASEFRGQVAHSISTLVAFEKIGNKKILCFQDDYTFGSITNRAAEFIVKYRDELIKNAVDQGAYTMISTAIQATNPCKKD